MTLVSPPIQPGTAAYTVTVAVDWQCALLQLGGDIDVAATAELTRILDCLDRMPAMTIRVDFSHVSFLDTAGVKPLVDAARRRRDYDWPPLLIDNLSAAAARLTVVAGLGPGPVLDIDGWDRLPDAVGRKGHTATEVAYIA